MSKPGLGKLAAEKNQNSINLVRIYSFFKDGGGR